jgi:hypothetical protein
MFRSLLSTDHGPSTLRQLALFELASDPFHIPELPTSNPFVDEQLTKFTEARKQKKGLIPRTHVCHLDAKSFADHVFMN